jgi:hypothetical protein
VRSSNSSRRAACASNSADEHRRKWRYGTSGHTGHYLRADPASRTARRALVTWHASPTSTCNVGGLQVAEGEKLQKKCSLALYQVLSQGRENLAPGYSSASLGLARRGGLRPSLWSAAFSKDLMRLLQRKRSSPNGLGGPRAASHGSPPRKYQVVLATVGLMDRRSTTVRCGSSASFWPQNVSHFRSTPATDIWTGARYRR